MIRCCPPASKQNLGFLARRGALMSGCVSGQLRGGESLQTQGSPMHVQTGARRQASAQRLSLLPRFSSRHCGRDLNKVAVIGVGPRLSSTARVAFGHRRLYMELNPYYTKYV